jgi:hypothetical protein
VITPVRFKERAYSTVLYYDWEQTKTQLALMFQGAKKPVFQGSVSLKHSLGYRLMRTGPKATICKSDLPGIVRPDWMSAAGCRCKAVVNRNSAFGLDAESQILSCPIKNQGARALWNWYTVDGRPLMFHEAAPKHTGFMLADYHDWLPGKTGTAADFKLPQKCKSADPSYWWRADNQARPDYSDCSGCHTIEN